MNTTTEKRVRSRGGCFKLFSCCWRHYFVRFGGKRCFKSIQFFVFFFFFFYLKSKIWSRGSRRENYMRSKQLLFVLVTSLATCVGQMASHPSSGICRRFATLVMLVSLARNSTFRLIPQMLGWGWGLDFWQATPSYPQPRSGVFSNPGKTSGSQHYHLEVWGLALDCYIDTGAQSL